MPQHIKEAMTSDFITPPGFNFCIECKYYDAIDLYEILRNPDNAKVVQFWEQALNDAERINQIPLLIMRETRKRPFAVYRNSDFPDKKVNALTFTHKSGPLSIIQWEDFIEAFPKEEFTNE
jgi:hypothetical protein